MANHELIDRMKDQIEAFSEFDIERLVARGEWGVINFKSAEQDIKLAFSIADDLNSLPIHYLTDKAANDISQTIPNVVDFLNQINHFSIESGNAQGNMQNLAASLHSSVESLHAAASIWIPYLAYKRGDIAKNIERLDTHLKQAKDKLSECNSWIENKQLEVEKIVLATQEAAASAGVAAFTQEFDRESSVLVSRSRKWLIATGLIAATMIGTASLFFFWPQSTENLGIWEALRNTVSKAAIIALLFTATIWCGRIYRAMIHQATVNRHRALSLRTFQAFAQSTNDPIIRDAVLMAATKAVFSPTATGLVERGDAEDTGVSFVEFGRSSRNITENIGEITQ